MAATMQAEVIEKATVALAACMKLQRIASALFELGSVQSCMAARAEIQSTQSALLQKIVATPPPAVPTAER